MIEIWAAIKLKLTEIAPNMLDNLNAGVTDKEVEDLEKLIKAKLPIEFVDFCKIHNGQKPGSAGLFDCEELLSFERIKDEWTAWKGLLDSKCFEDEGGHFTSLPDNGIKNEWWNALWIPITYDGSGNHYCLDLDPAGQGSYGQIIRMWHDDAERSLEAASFKDWVLAYKDKLVGGQLVYSEDYFGIVDKKEVGEY
jgi:cell wall assembly regulator SMI1